MIDDRVQALNWIATGAIVGVLFLVSFALGWQLAIKNALAYGNSDGEVAVQMEQSGMEYAPVVEISELAIPGWVTIVGLVLGTVVVASIAASLWLLWDRGELDLEKVLPDSNGR